MNSLKKQCWFLLVALACCFNWCPAPRYHRSRSTTSAKDTKSRYSKQRRSHSVGHLSRTPLVITPKHALTRRNNRIMHAYNELIQALPRFRSELKNEITRLYTEIQECQSGEAWNAMQPVRDQHKRLSKLYYLIAKTIQVYNFATITKDMMSGNSVNDKDKAMLNQLKPTVTHWYAKELLASTQRKKMQRDPDNLPTMDKKLVAFAEQLQTSPSLVPPQNLQDHVQRIFQGSPDAFLNPTEKLGTGKLLSQTMHELKQPQNSEYLTILKNKLSAETRRILFIDNTDLIIPIDNTDLIIPLVAESRDELESASDKPSENPQIKKLLNGIGMLNLQYTSLKNKPTSLEALNSLENAGFLNKLALFNTILDNFRQTLTMQDPDTGQKDNNLSHDDKFRLLRIEGFLNNLNENIEALRQQLPTGTPAALPSTLPSPSISSPSLPSKSQTPGATQSILTPSASATPSHTTQATGATKAGHKRLSPSQSEKPLSPNEPLTCVSSPLSPDLKDATHRVSKPRELPIKPSRSSKSPHKTRSPRHRSRSQSPTKR